MDARWSLKIRLEFPSVSPVQMLPSSPVSAAELDSCPSDTFLLLQGFPTSASTEKACARELRPCILAEDPVVLRTLLSVWTLIWSRTVSSVSLQLIQGRTGQSRQQQQQHLREPLFSVTLRNWSGAFPCVLQDTHLHPKPLITGTPLPFTTIFPSLPLYPFPCLPFPLCSVEGLFLWFPSARHREGGKSAACIPPHGPALQKKRKTPSSKLSILTSTLKSDCLETNEKTVWLHELKYTKVIKLFFFNHVRA